MLDVDIDKLELCPFCGSEAKKHTFDDPDSPYCGGTVIECTKCGATTPVYFGDSDINVTYAWNRRDTNFNKVINFHRTFGAMINIDPTIVDDQTALLRKNLIIEEQKELFDAIDQKDIKQIAKETADLLYVVYGLAVTCGIPINQVFAEVHRSNMSKLTKEGEVLRREDGKVLKSEQYTPANLDFLVVD